jgi:hypothetical protein
VNNLDEKSTNEFKLESRRLPADEHTARVDEFQFEMASGRIERAHSIIDDDELIGPRLVQQYDPSLFLDTIEQSLESVVNRVMQTGENIHIARRSAESHEPWRHRAVRKRVTNRTPSSSR